MPTVLARRWACTDRLVQVSLRRDHFSEVPGEGLSLWMGERTSYRNAAWVADSFDVLNDRYSQWLTFNALVLGANGLEPNVIGVDCAFKHDAALNDRAQWAEIEIGALASSDVGGHASVGILLRASDFDGYMIIAAREAGVGLTRIGRLSGGSVVWLAAASTPWVAGERMRASVDGLRIRAYRQDVAILEHTDTSLIPVVGSIGLEAMRFLASDIASIRSWSGGQRQEYNGILSDTGDVSAALGFVDPTGEPARWDMVLSNLQPIGGANRFAELIRQGLRDEGAYDVIGAPIRMNTAFAGASVPLASARGKIEAISALDETRVRLVCGGPDSNLEPDIDGVLVAYLPSSPPFAGPPALPEDPCAVSEAGDEDEGTPPVPPIEEDDEGDGGPEEPPDITTVIALLGAYIVSMNYTVSYGGGPLGSDVYVGSTSVTPLPISGAGTPTPDKYDGVFLNRRRIIGAAGSQQFPEFIQEDFLYRGPDVPGGHIGQIKQLASIQNQGVIATGSIVPAPVDWQITVKFAEYRANKIFTVADLAALRPQDPGQLQDPFPERIQTLGGPFGHSIQFEPSTSEECIRCANEDDAISDLHYHVDQFGNELFVNVTWERYTFAVNHGVIGEIPLNRFTGPQIVRIEIESASGSGMNPSTADVRASAQSSEFVDEVYQVGFIGSNARNCPPATWVHLTEREHTIGRGPMSVVG